MTQHSPEQEPVSILLPCRIFYSTQSGRAKASARRTARILHDRAVMHRHLSDHHPTTTNIHPLPQQPQQQPSPMIQLQNGHGTTFDEAFDECMNRNEAFPTKSPMEQFVHQMKQSGTAVLLCFISTTGDGEHTVRTYVYMDSYII